MCETLGEYFKQELGHTIPECYLHDEPAATTDLSILKVDDYQGRMVRLIDVTKVYLQKLDTELGFEHITNGKKEWVGIEKDEYMPVLQNLTQIMMVIHFG